MRRWILREEIAYIFVDSYSHRAQCKAYVRVAFYHFMSCTRPKANKHWRLTLCTSTLWPCPRYNTIAIEYLMANPNSYVERIENQKTKLRTIVQRWWWCNDYGCHSAHRPMLYITVQYRFEFGRSHQELLFRTNEILTEFSCNYISYFIIC